MGVVPRPDRRCPVTFSPCLERFFAADVRISTYILTLRPASRRRARYTVAGPCGVSDDHLHALVQKVFVSRPGPHTSAHQERQGVTAIYTRLPTLMPATAPRLNTFSG